MNKFEIQITYKNEYINQEMSIIPRVGDTLIFSENEKFPEFDYVAEYLVTKVKIFVSEDMVDAEVIVDKLAK